MADIVPAAVARLEPHLQMRLKITQQTREEDIPRVREIYAKAQVSAEIAPFFNDLPAQDRRESSCGVSIRCGNGLGIVGHRSAGHSWCRCPARWIRIRRPMRWFWKKAGGAVRLLQRDFTPDRLAAEIDALAADPSRLSAMAQGAKSIGVLDAADRLADLVLNTVRVPS